MKKTIIAAEDASALAREALKKIGLDDGEIRHVAPHLVDAELTGYDYAGLVRILKLKESPRIHDQRCAPAIVQETPASALIDGRGSFGYVAVDIACDHLIEKVKKAGIAVVGVYNAWNSGRAGYYVERVARAGFVVIHTISSTPMVIPPGSAQRGLGTNPIAIGLPRQPHPLVIDLGTSAITFSEVLAMADSGGTFAGAPGVDADGRPTGIAAEMLKGGILPFGGHKGFALSLAVQALGLCAGAGLSGDSPIDFGYLLIAFRPDLLLPQARLEADVDRLAAHLKGLARAGDQVRIPSERAFRDREARLREGIALDQEIYDRLRSL